jgi:glycosyltransferase involved in cell wall biosynthesis
MSRNVLVVTQSFPPEMGGNASRIGDTTSYLAEEDWDLTVVAPSPCYPPGQFPRSWSLREETERDGVTVHRLWTWQPISEDPGLLQRAAYYLIFALHALAWVLQHGNEYDAVLTSTPPIFTGIPGFVAKYVHDMQWIVDVRDLWIDAAANLDEVSLGIGLIGVSRRYQRLVLASADRVLTTTPELCSRLADTYGALTEKFAVVPNGVDTSRFTPDDRLAQPRVVYTGNLGHAQDIETCIRAMQYVKSEASFWIVGDGDRQSALRRLAADLDIEDEVEFVGLVGRDRVPDLLNSSAVGVAPVDSAEELSYAVPTKAFEYMASELPVVATGNGAVERLVAESDAGVVVDDGPKALAETFDRLIVDDDLRHRLGHNGRRYVVRERDRGEIARQISDELHDLVGTRRATIKR